MANFTAGTSFTEGVTNDVTADKLRDLVQNAVPTSNLSLTSTTGTIATFNSTTGTIATLNSTTGTIATLNSTTGTITTGVIPTLTSTTLITTGTGTAAAPAIVPTGDTNTGIFFPAADTIAFSEGGAEAMRIDSSGQVGIGTTSPLGKLKVTVGDVAPAASGNMNTGVVIESDPASRSLNLGANNSAGYSWINAAFSNNSGTPDNLVLMTGATEHLRINSSGNVGIGTTNPASKLTVASGDIKISDNFGIGAGGGAQIIYNGTSQFLRFDTASTERLRIDSSGSLILAGSTAQKASGTTWSNPSDIRIKKNIRDYEKGLDSLMQVRVREWEYNGKAGTVADTKSMGVVADEVETILPDTVSTYKAKLNPEDEEDSDIKKFDATEITWLLVKAVQELSAKVTALEAA